MRVAIAFLFYVFAFSGVGQNANKNWYFGTGAALTFSNGDAMMEQGNQSMICLDNGASVSDPYSGELLFYSNGYQVWNANHEVMPNGSGLLGHNSGGNCAYAVQNPGNSNEFYLFTSDAWAGSNGIRYSIINMALDEGNGDIGSVKNEMLLDQATEKISSVRHANGNDVWLIVHDWGSSLFFSYLISENGISETPVVSDVGSIHYGGAGLNYNAAGQIVANDQNNKIACAIYQMGTVEIFDFNNVTGALSDPKIISDDNAWGLAFSPSGEFLFVSHWGGSKRNTIHQYKVSYDDEGAIEESLVAIAGLTGPNASYIGGYLQKGPNNKIYIAKFQSNFLAEIQNPNALGLECNIVDNAINLGQGVSQAGLPSITVAKAGIVSTQEVLKDEWIKPLKIYPNPANEIFNIDLNTTHKNTLVQVFKSNGELLLKDYFSEQKIDIDVSNYQNGFYYLQIITCDQVVYNSILVKQ